MTTDLVQKLRTCSKEERRDIAMKLAQTGIDEAVKELIYIADGGQHTPAVYGRKHWYSISIDSCLQPKRWEYDLSDQLCAIEALGETRSKIALDFLRKIHTPTMKALEESPGHYLYYEGEELIDFSYMEYKPPKGLLRRYEVIDFGNARGPLRDVLHCLIQPPACDSNDKLKEHVGELRRKKLESEPHKTIILAIQKLESIVQNNSPQYNPLTIFTFSYMGTLL